ncbi:MAG: glycerophosphodiester phosphodiesterase [Candidatus Woesearchaeota archaeon]
MTYVMAHRGASSIAPENSLQAFIEAINLGADYVELDVRRCNTGELIVIHDSKVNRVTNGEGHIKALTFEEISNLVILDNTRLLTLDEALDFLNGRCGVNIEIKSRKIDYDIADRILYMIKERDMQQKVMISSFNHKILRYIKHSSPNIETAALFVRRKSPGTFFRRLYYMKKFIRKARHIGADALNLPHKFITGEIMRMAASNGLLVNAWTVNSDKEIARMLGLGVNAIITDYPQKITTYSKS